MRTRGEIRNFVASRLPGYSMLDVVYGNKITLPEAKFDWKGAGQYLYLCWAPKPKHWVDFNGGQNIPGGLWGWAKFWAPESATFQQVHLTGLTAASLNVEIRADVHTDSQYDSWIWICDDRYGKAITSPDTIGQGFLVIDNDADVFRILMEAQIENLNVGYAKV